jgi:hypothetical protein
MPYRAFFFLDASITGFYWFVKRYLILFLKFFVAGHRQRIRQPECKIIVFENAKFLNAKRKQVFENSNSIELFLKTIPE